MLSRALVAAALLAMAGAIGFFFFAAWVVEAPAIPSSKMAQIADGMTEADILQLLGRPSSTESTGDTVTWMYHRMTWATYYVTFGPDGKILHHYHDP